MINGLEAMVADENEKTNDSIKIFLYIVMTYGISWTIWFSTNNPVIGIVGSCMPSIVGLCFLMISKDSIHKGFLKRAVNFKLIQLRWYMVILLFMPVVMLLSHFTQKLLGGPVPSFASYINNITNMQNIGLMVFLAYGSGLGEEFGWRGLMLDTLQKHLGRIVSSLLVGIVWAAWHIPFSVKNNESLLSLSFLNYFSFVVLLSVLIAIVYNNNNQSILSSILLHAIANFIQYIMFKNQPVPLGMSISMNLFTLLAVVLLSFRLNHKVISAKA